MVQKRRFFCALLVLFYLLISHQSASAHAILIGAEPTDGAVVAVAPTTIQLWFNEAIVERFSSVQLLDQANQPVADLTIQVDATDQLRISLPALAPGGYTLFWKVLSDVDGHFSHGFTTLYCGCDENRSFLSAITQEQNSGFHTEQSINVGQGALVGPVPAATADALPTWPEVGLRWANYFFLTSLIGALVILQFVLSAAQDQANAFAAAAQKRLRRQVLVWAASSAGSAFLIGLGLLGWQVMAAQPMVRQAGGFSADAWLTDGWLVLTQTHWGLIWLARQGLLLLLGGGLWFLSHLRTEPQTTWLWLLVYGRVIELAIVQAFAGHALGSSTHWLLALGNATLHLLAASVWMGGLLVIVWCLLPTIKRERQRIPDWQPLCWRNFSLLAAISTGLLFATGIFSTGQQVASLDALLTTRYGQVLVGKVGLVLCAGIYGLGNAFLIHPMLALSLGKWLGPAFIWIKPAPYWFFALLTHEATLGILILATVGVLTATPPPRSLDYTIAPEAIKPLQGQRVDDLIVTLEAKPNRLGQNLFNIRLNRTQTATETTAAKVGRVWLNFTYSSKSGKAVTAIADEVESNLYQVTGNYLTQAGPWQIDVVIQRYGIADTHATFDWMAPPMGEVQPVLVSKAPLANVLTPVAITLAVLLIVAIYRLRSYGFTFQTKQSYADSVNVNSLLAERSDFANLTALDPRRVKEGL